MSTTTTLQYITRPSSNDIKNPKGLILIHGYGSNEQDLFSFAPYFDKDIFVISVKAPISMQPFGNAWYEIHIDDDGVKSSNTQQALEAKQLLIEFIDYTREHYHLKDISLLGFSQGAILSYAIGISMPKKISSIIALSGCLNPDLIEDISILKSNDYKHLSIYASHGIQDQIIPIDWARKAQSTLNELGIDNQWSEYHAAHGVCPENFNSLLAWAKECL